MEEVQTSNKLPWIIAGVVVLFIILVGITVLMFGNSPNKTEKPAEDMTIQETINSCMQTCKQLPAGSTRTNCETGCAQVQPSLNKELTEAGIQGSADMTTDEVLQAIITECINRCQTSADIPEQYKPTCIENCKSTQ